MTTTETQAPPAETPKAQATETAHGVQQEAERPPQTEEVLCTICGMRSCWR